MRIFFHFALACGLVLALWRSVTIQFPVFAPPEYRVTLTPASIPLFEREFIPTIITTPAVHSATIVELPNGHILAAWFGGSREGAKDVAIYAAEKTTTGWSNLRIIADRISTETDLGRPLRKLGNPVLSVDAKGRLWLFFVTVSLGGWSTSNIAYKISADAGRNFGPARLLVTSPLINISTLVRTRPLLYTDGSIALPVYHELLGKFGLLLRINSNERIQSLTHIGGGRNAIQPSIVATDTTNAWALLRRTASYPTQVLMATSYDGGAHWTWPQATDLPNPNSSVAAINGHQGGLLLVYNPSVDGRETLSVATSANGQYWQRLRDLEHGNSGAEFSYPFLIRTPPDNYNLVYTWQRHRIAYVRFNDAWLKQVP